jgi:hypothetical protein
MMFSSSREERNPVDERKECDGDSHDDDRSEMQSREGGGFGVELVLSSPTTDTERAKDMIVRPPSSSQRHNKSNSSTCSVESSRKSMSHNSRFSEQQGNSGSSKYRYPYPPRSRLMGSLIDDASETSSVASNVYNQPKTISQRRRDGDDVWRAAKRGDLASLKSFHSEGNIDWAAKDQFNNIPLYYACHSGAIVDINVVHFLLWVTPIKNSAELEKCKNRKNKAVMKILNDFEASGYKSTFTMPVKAPTESRNKQVEKNTAVEPKGKPIEKDYKKVSVVTS